MAPARERQEWLAAAMAVVRDEGVAALSLDRLAAAAEVPVSVIAERFPSTGSLVAELERAAADRILASYLLGRAGLEERLERESEGRVAALARIVGFARFWLAASESLAEDVQLLLRLVFEPRVVVPVDEAGRALPAALRLVDHIRGTIDEAGTAGALRPGDGMVRAIEAALVVTASMQAAKLAAWDRELFDGDRLASDTLRDLLVGWGAQPDEVEQAARHVDAAVRRASLAPVPPSASSGGGASGA